MDPIDQIVEEVKPDNGWWKNDSEGEIRRVAAVMLDFMDPDTVEECIRDVCMTMRDEYGD